MAHAGKVKIDFEKIMLENMGDNPISNIPNYYLARASKWGNIYTDIIHTYMHA